MAYATWNPSDKHADVTLSNGNLTAEAAVEGWRSVRGTIGKSSGKHYWEITIDENSSEENMGVAKSATALDASCGSDAYSYAYHSDDGDKYHNGSYSGYGSLYYNTVISIALDLDNGKIWFGKNGVWQASGDPVAGTNPAFTGLSGTFYPMASFNNDKGLFVTANFGASSFSHSVPSGFNAGLFDSAPEGETTEGLGISAAADAVNLAGRLEQGLGLEAGADAFNLSDGFDGGLGLGAGADAFNLSDGFGEGLGLNAGADAGGEYGRVIAGGLGLSVGVTVTGEYNRGVSQTLGLCVETDCFNWTSWLTQNLFLAVPRFYLTLTGDANGVSDLEIPISSFQGRFSSGTPSYLGVVIPGTDHAGDINDRINGDLVVELAYLLNGEESLREEIARTALENIRIDEGSRQESITLTGHRTETWPPKIVALMGENYRYLSAGKLRYRCFPDLYLRPGDTVRAGEDEFTAGLVTYMVNTARQVMEVSEA